MATNAQGSTSPQEERLGLVQARNPYLVIGVAAALILATTAVFVLSQAAPDPWKTPAAIAPLAAVALGAFAGGFVLCGALARPETAPRLLSPVLAAVVVIASATLAAVVIHGAIAGVLQPAPAALVLIFGSLTLLAGACALDSARRGEGISIESHWGGLGGGLSGARLSTSAVLLFLFLVLSSATILVSVADPKDISKALLTAPDKPNKQTAGDEDGTSNADPSPEGDAAGEAAGANTDKTSDAARKDKKQAPADDPCKAGAQGLTPAQLAACATGGQ